jgi:hypothetical protein
MLRIDLDSDLHQLMLFFQNFEKLMQVHHGNLIPGEFKFMLWVCVIPASVR